MIKIQINLWTIVSVGIVLCAWAVAYGQQDAMKQNALALRQVHVEITNTNKKGR